MQQIKEPICLTQFFISFIQALKNNIETLTSDLAEVVTSKDKFEKDLEQTLQQLTEAKTSIGDLKAQNDEISGKMEENTIQNKVSYIINIVAKFKII